MIITHFILRSFFQEKITKKVKIVIYLHILKAIFYAKSNNHCVIIFWQFAFEILHQICKIKITYFNCAKLVFVFLWHFIFSCGQHIFFSTPIDCLMINLMYNTCKLLLLSAFYCCFNLYIKISVKWIKLIADFFRIQSQIYLKKRFFKFFVERYLYRTC